MSYDPSLSDPVSKVRFHIGDTGPDTFKLPDQTIASLLAEKGSLGATVIACLDALLSQLNDPSFSADWLKVDIESARRGIMMLKITKQTEFGINTGSGLRVPVYRSDYPEKAKSQSENS